MNTRSKPRMKPSQHSLKDLSLALPALLILAVGFTGCGGHPATDKSLGISTPAASSSSTVTGTITTIEGDPTGKELPGVKIGIKFLEDVISGNLKAARAAKCKDFPKEDPVGDVVRCIGDSNLVPKFDCRKAMFSNEDLFIYGNLVYTKCLNRNMLHYPGSFSKSKSGL